MSTLLARYEALIAGGELRPDPAQTDAARILQDIQDRLVAQVLPRWRWPARRRRREHAGGAYLWGGVGRGKSMLMDLYHQTLPLAGKRRVHFHAFMQEVHALLRQERAKAAGDPIPAVARRIADGLHSLAFDEMIVTNSADAMIMSRLFRALMVEEQVTVVTTSNRAPGDLYKDGLNREHFLPFIDLLEQRLAIVELNGQVDYRLARMAGLTVWHTPLGDAATQRVREAFFRLTDFAPEDAAHVPSEDLPVGGGRSLHVPKSLKGVAVFSFRRLCGEPRGAPDYLAVARTFHTVIVVGIPHLTPDMRNEAARFTALVDALYEYRVKLFATAAAEPDDLYPSGDGTFEFARTVSRLHEMRSDAYLALGHGSG
ncbi:cell division protein ZapE [Erythrobacteraceae bacterium CFH 75059]|uniref:cell division protein ZapE n=1 Tax=Qipengyuania thermophila TaxID=2509361 RepID=UPI00102183B8|nr:cell division protein ZapE [Qipengyuania thermophila]TCD05318.1 cell division protein ZapE [Erythrobacteraceae bacterium CFH 75059]